MIDSEEALRQAVAAAVRQDPALATLLAAAGHPPLRKRDPGFAGLAAIVTSQQVSAASARAIWGRVVARFGDLAPAHVAAASDEELKACGLSTPKIRTLRAVAAAVLEGELPLEDLGGWPADEAHARLVTVKGIGPWTADVYLLFCLGHPDAFPAGDLALQEAARVGFGLQERPSPAALTQIAERWRPWRGAVAKLLWAYYAVARGGRDAAPAGTERNI